MRHLIAEARAILAQDSLVEGDLYLPKAVRDTPPNVDVRNTDLKIWTWEEQGRFNLIAFQGKASKPIAHFYYNTDTARAKKVQSLIQGRESSIRAKAQRKQDAKAQKDAAVAKVKVGDVYYTSWGYDQTNVEFFQVTVVKGSMVSLREVAKRVDHETTGASYVVPVKDRFVGKELKKRVDRSIRIDNVRRAFPWEGKPMYTTASGWGH